MGNLINQIKTKFLKLKSELKNSKLYHVGSSDNETGIDNFISISVISKGVSVYGIHYIEHQQGIFTKFLLGSDGNSSIIMGATNSFISILDIEKDILYIKEYWDNE